MQGGRRPSEDSSGRIDLDAVADEEKLKLPVVYDPSEDREHARRNLAYALLALLAFIVIGLLVAVFAKWTSIDDVKDLAGIILAPIVALVGTVSGFYFGGHDTQRSS